MNSIALTIWINVLASLAIFISAMRLYQVHGAQMPVATRAFFAAVACAALWSVGEILAWRQPIPVGMTAFLILLALGWGLRAFTPICLLPAVLAGSAPARAPLAARSDDRPMFALQNQDRWVA